MSDSTRQTVVDFVLQDRKPILAAMLLAAALALTLVVLASTLHDIGHRLLVLKIVLLLIATGETVGAAVQLFFTKETLMCEGRPYHPTLHGPINDFAFYNIAMALLLVLTATNPEAGRFVIFAVIALYAVHGTAHVLRHFMLIPGGSTRVGLDLKQGIPLLVVALALVLFFP